MSFDYEIPGLDMGRRDREWLQGVIGEALATIGITSDCQRADEYKDPDCGHCYRCSLIMRLDDARKRLGDLWKLETAKTAKEQR